MLSAGGAKRQLRELHVQLSERARQHGGPVCSRTLPILTTEARRVAYSQVSILRPAPCAPGPLVSAGIHAAGAGFPAMISGIAAFELLLMLLILRFEFLENKGVGGGAYVMARSDDWELESESS